MPRLCQERGGVDIYQDDASTVKWSIDNELDIIIVAIYQRGLVLQYIDELLTVCKQQFITMLRQLPRDEWDGAWPCNKFTATFSKLQQDVEKRAVEAKLQQKKPRSFADSKKFQNTRQGARLPPSRPLLHRPLVRGSPSLIGPHRCCQGKRSSVSHPLTGHLLTSSRRRRRRPRSLTSARRPRPRVTRRGARS